MQTRTSGGVDNNGKQLLEPLQTPKGIILKETDIVSGRVIKQNVEATKFGLSPSADAGNYLKGFYSDNNKLLAVDEKRSNSRILDKI